MAALAVIAAAACAPTQPAVRDPQSAISYPQSAIRVTATILGDPPSLYTPINPAGTTRGQEAVRDMVHAGLSVVDDRGALVPRLGEAVPTIENGLWRVFPDGRMETVWRIRAGAQWHDGTAFTAQDLVFTLLVYRDKDLPEFGSVIYDAVEAAEAPDARTVIVAWKRPYLDADAMFAGTRALPLPRHLLERAYQDDKESFMRLPYWWTPEFVGAGPYRVRDWVRGSHLVADAFDGFVLGRPRIDALEVRFVSDTNTIMANVLAGAVQLTLGKTLSNEQALEVRDRWREGTVDIAPANPIMIHPQHLTPNPAIVADLGFRRALFHAIDRQQLADSLIGGLSPPYESVVGPRDAEYEDVAPRIVRYDFDPGRAVQLIEATGHVRGADGAFRGAAGQRLSVELRTVAVDVNEKAILAVADYWQRVGVPTEAFVIPPQRGQDRAYRSTFPGFELVRSGGTVGNLPELHSSNIATPGNQWTGGTRTRYKNDEFDSLIERYLATISRRARTPILGDIVFHMTDRLVQMGLFHDVEASMISNRLTRVRARHAESSQTWNVHEWTLRD